MIEEFIKKLKSLKPSKRKMLNEGYSEKFITQIHLHEFNLIKEQNEDSNFPLDDFIKNYNKDNFRVQNIFFNNKLEDDIINNHLIFGSIEGGYIFCNEKTREFYTAYADDIEGSKSLLCSNDLEFFEILLVVAEYSSKSYEGIEIDEDDLEDYILKCENISSEGNFYALFS